MHNRAGFSRVMTILGSVILAAAIVLLAVYEITRKRPPANEEAVCAIYSVIPPFSEGGLDDREDLYMPLYNYKGFEYAGILTFDTLSLEVPVLGSYNEGLFENTPCVYSGSVYNGTLTIAGGNDRNVFGPLLQTDVGEKFSFTDVSGEVYHYEVTKISHAKDMDKDPADEDSDLTLITKTREGKYAFIRCVMK